MTRRLKVMRPFIAVLAIAVASCTTDRQIRRIQEFRAARERGDLERARTYIAPGARLFFEEKKGEGEPYSLGGGRWERWDEYFGSVTTLSDWRVHGQAVTATVRESNEFMRLLEWEPKPYTITWWLDDQGRIVEALVKSTPGKPRSRLDEFKAWARERHPEELGYLLPNDRIDPTGDRPERWKTILNEWISTREARVQP